jgi:SAM-dependent methyltransferase
MRRVCLACGELLPEDESFAAREMMFGTKDAFHYCGCTRCGSVTLLDPPSDWTRYYEHESYYSMRESPVLPAPSWRRLLKTDTFLRAPAMLTEPALPKLRRGRLSIPSWYWWFRSMGLRRDSRILDVGSGSGALLHKLAADGFTSLTGVDPFVRDSLDYSDGVRIVKGEIASLSVPFDVIMFHHSLEHVESPQGQLGAARSVLRRGGIVIVRVPVADSWAYRYYGADWVQLDPPRHQIIMTSETVKLLAKRSGYVLQRAYRDSEARQIWGSELYKRDVKLVGADPSKYFSPVELDEFQSRTRQLNRSSDGDQAVFLLRPVGLPEHSE